MQNRAILYSADRHRKSVRSESKISYAQLAAPRINKYAKTLGSESKMACRNILHTLFDIVIQTTYL